MEYHTSGAEMKRRTAKFICDMIARPGETRRVPRETYRKAPTEGEGFFASRGVKRVVVEERRPSRKK